MAFVPADRRGAGGLLSMSVADNVVSASLPRFSPRRLAAARRHPARGAGPGGAARRSHLASRPEARTLSGGNQQKIILGRSLVTNPRVLILHEPTRGIDVGAKAEIYSILRGIAGEGVAIVLDLVGDSGADPERRARAGPARRPHVRRARPARAINEEAILARGHDVMSESDA